MSSIQSSAIWRGVWVLSGPPRPQVLLLGSVLPTGLATSQFFAKCKSMTMTQNWVEHSSLLFIPATPPQSQNLEGLFELTRTTTNVSSGTTQKQGQSMGVAMGRWNPQLLGRRIKFLKATIPVHLHHHCRSFYSALVALSLTLIGRLPIPCGWERK